MMPAATRPQLWSVVAVAALSAAFLVRVAGQAVQRWFPQGFLPPFEAWQGSGIPYPSLLACQIVIIALLAVAICSMVHRARLLSGKGSRWVMIIGCAYFVLMLARLVLGLTVLGDSAWFTAWISALLHLDLAIVIILWGRDQHRLARTGNTG
jgi:hypothetical protein